jgi:thiol-disulfide isomerase/thioredoxin
MLRTALGAALLLAAPFGQSVGADSEAPAAANVGPAPEHRHAAPADDPNSGAALLGANAPDWTFTRWIGPAYSLPELRGKAVLVRWWTEGCHFCAHTLPELEALRRKHADEGLVVIGVFHPKPPREVSDKRILALAKRLGFAGPIAVDREWATLDRYWLDGHPERSWTSVSFLIDRQGVIRWVHGGGEYHRSGDPAHARCDLQYRELEETLAAVLAEKATAAAP